MNKGDKRKAVIYCRTAVADRQADAALQSKESRCRQQAALSGHDVVAVFADKGVSGRSARRAGFDEALGYLRNLPEKSNLTLLIDAPSDLARDIAVYTALKQDLSEAGAELEIVSSDLGDICAIPETQNRGAQPFEIKEAP